MIPLYKAADAITLGPATVRTAAQSAWPLLLADARDRQAHRPAPAVPVFVLTRNGPRALDPDSATAGVERLARLHGCRAASVRQRIAHGDPDAYPPNSADVGRFAELWTLAREQGFASPTTCPAMLRWLAGPDPTGTAACRYSALIEGVSIAELA